MKKNFVGLAVFFGIIFSAVTASADSALFDGSRLQLSQSFGSQETHTLYQDQEVPDTCYRDEQQGFRQECSTQYQQQCGFVTRQQCETVNNPVCRSETTCQPPRPGVPAGSCETHRVCENNTSERCWPVSENVCENVPYQACESVPNIVSVAYACTKTVSVAVGTALDYNVAINATLNFDTIPAGIRPNETFELSYNQGDVQLSLGQSTNQLLFSITKSVKTQIIGNQQKQVDAVFNISVISAQDAAAPLAAGISDVSIDGRTMKFSLGQIPRPELLSLNLKLTLQRWFGNKDVFNAALNASNAKFSASADGRTLVQVDLTQILAAGDIQKKTYKVSINAGVNLGAIQGLLNPEAIAGKTTASKNSQFTLK